MDVREDVAFQVDTEYPLALDSYDYIHPAGATGNNFTNPNFNLKLRNLIGHPYSLLDLGCAMGGFVESVIKEGNLAVGLEGSDYCLKRKKGSWNTIPDNLFTCDVSRPFTVSNNGVIFHFDVITAWEILEHIVEERIPVVLDNIKMHLKSNGLLIISTTNKPAIHKDGTELHRTRKPLNWWIETILRLGFQHSEGAVRYFGKDWVRSHWHMVFVKLGEDAD